MCKAIKVSAVLASSRRIYLTKPCLNNAENEIQKMLEDTTHTLCFMNLVSLHQNSQIWAWNESPCTLKIAINNKYLAHNLGQSKITFRWRFRRWTLDNLYEAGYVIVLSDWHVSDFQWTKRITHLDIANKRESFTVYERSSAQNAGKIEKLLSICQNFNIDYPIEWSADKIEDAAYRSWSKVWMTYKVFGNYLTNADIVGPIEYNRTRVT